MEEAVIHPPRTIMEVFKTLPEGTLAEVIDNTLYMSPTPIGRHQRLIRVLSTQMDLHTTQQSLGEIFFAPFDVYLDETSNAVQPDILFIRKENLHICNDNGHVHGVPDLIIELIAWYSKARHDQKKSALRKIWC